ncbi:TcmI family type II polyketide cyclase [Streptomyces bathyalis]|nr:TcmI family type II polyketide cyclase [Streptomyces bathyalis]
MQHRTMMVNRFKDPSAHLEIADLFAEHDRSSLPIELGVSRRTLFRYRDLYVHLIETDEELMPNLNAARQDPHFQKINERLGHLLDRYDSKWTEMEDSRAEAFYDWVPEHRR